MKTFSKFETGSFYLRNPFSAASLCLVDLCPRVVWKLISFSPSIASGKQRHLLSPLCLKLELEMMSWDSQIKSVRLY